jgi:hypothetical protein
MAVNRRALLRTGLAVSALGAVRPAIAAASTNQVTEPQIYDTRNWNARDPNGTIQVINQRPSFIVVHHTAGENSNDFSLSHAFQICRDIQNLHMDTNGWIDTGQQLTNSRGGFVMEGRHRSLEVLTGGTRHVIGANVANNNSTVIGIENEGLYMTVDVTPALWNSLVNLVAYIASQYAIPVSQIKGHRDFNSTLCPGDVLYSRLPELRSAVASKLGTGFVEPATWPLLRPGDTGAKVLAAQHLLRARGLSGVATDGVFGTAMFDAARQFTKQSGIPYEPCYACPQSDETGLIGSATWPLLIRPTSPNDTTEDGKAASVLLDSRGTKSLTSNTIDAATWQSLLS